MQNSRTTRRNTIGTNHVRSFQSPVRERYTNIYKYFGAWQEDLSVRDTNFPAVFSLSGFQRTSSLFCIGKCVPLLILHKKCNPIPPLKIAFSYFAKILKNHFDISFNSVPCNYFLKQLRGAVKHPVTKNSKRISSHSFSEWVP